MNRSYVSTLLHNSMSTTTFIDEPQELPEDSDSEGDVLTTVSESGLLGEELLTDVFE